MADRIETAVRQNAGLIADQILDEPDEDDDADEAPDASEATG